MLGGEFEGVGRRRSSQGPTSRGPRRAHALSAIPRLAFRVPPDRASLPPLERYATLQDGDERRVARLHRGQPRLQAPLPPLSDRAGLRRPLPRRPRRRRDRRRRGAGGGGRAHITFGDPDFFNGIRHARAVVDALAASVRASATTSRSRSSICCEHADALPLLRDTGCAFVTSAVESLDDGRWRALEKGTRAPTSSARSRRAARRAHARRRRSSRSRRGRRSRATCELLREIDRLELVEHVAPIQLRDRLLVPQGRGCWSSTRCAR